MGRKRALPWRTRIAAAVVLLAVAGGTWLWWTAQHWTPPRDEFPTQGVLVGAADGAVDFRALAAVGANFAYLEASKGEQGRDAMLAENLVAVADSGLPFGVVHAYDPCIAAERQAANFVTIVPRDAAMLPPVIALETSAGACADPVTEAGVESELTTFLNQVESHMGQPAILKLGREFQERHPIAAVIERNLWLDGAFLEPEYAGRPFTLWTANPRLWSEVTSQPVRWVVVQP